MATPFEDTKYLADFLRVMPNQEYSLESAHVRNTTGAEVALDGTPLPVALDGASGRYEVMTALAAGTPANIDGFIVSARKETLAATTGVSSQPHAILVRGPAVVSQEAFSATDLAGASYDAADFVTALGAMNPPVVVRDSSENLRATRYDG